MSRIPLLAVLLAVVAAAPAAPAAAADRVVTVKGVDGPGPAATDRVRVLEQGPRTARHVLVLVPGTQAGAASFRPVAADLVRRLPGWQVWSVDRRENALEDHSMLDRFLAGRATGQELFDFYLGWIGSASPPASHFTPVADADVPYAREWGMRVAVGDLRRVIARARRGGRTVVLGGHSLGGTITTAYATWDFNGRAGARDLAGLVYIDGGSGGVGRKPITPAEARTQLDAIATGSPFLDLLGLGLPWATGVFNAVGSSLAVREPDARSPFDGWPLLPAVLRPPVPVTNAAAYGYAVDTETSPPSLALVQMHLGSLAPSGDPRGWTDRGGLVPVRRAATVFSGIRGLDGTAWYHPRRLSLDGGAVNNGIPTPAQRTLGLRTTHGRDVHLPIYAFAASLGGERVLSAARALARHSHVPRRRVTLVDRSKTYAHIDPLAAPGERNAFVRTVVPFLRRIG